MDESNGTCGLRLESVGVENTEENRQKWRQTLLGTKDLGKYCGGAILFSEPLGKDLIVLVPEDLTIFSQHMWAKLQSNISVCKSLWSERR